jgi:arylsulfatase A-like enzyme
MVENVFIYASDSLRWDHLPESVRDRGVAFETVAQSLFSAPSFATIATGLYPQQHGVLDWQHRMPDSVGTIFELEGVDAGFWQAGEIAGHEIYPILRQEGKTELADLSEPFVYLERNDDPHVPFADSGADSAREYYDTRGTDYDRIREEYRHGAEVSAERFAERLDELDDRGVLEDTLVVFTSDHGELLGEHGEMAHTSPACPELAYVPTVFVHPSLDGDDFHADPETEIIEHVDVVATLLGALGREAELPTAGVDLRSEPRSRAWGVNHIDTIRRGRSVYRADSLWWPDGGYVFHQNSTALRATKGLYRLARSASRSALRGRPLSLLKTYVQSETAYGNPPVTLEEARALLEEFQDGIETVESRAVDLDDGVEQRLEDMGYR